LSIINLDIKVSSCITINVAEVLAWSVVNYIMIMLRLEAIVTSVSRYDLIRGKECWAVGTVNLLVWVSNRVGNGGVVAILIS